MMLAITTQMVLNSSLNLVLNFDSERTPASLIGSVELLQGLRQPSQEPLAQATG